MTKLLFDVSESVDKEQPEVCKGLLFRANVSGYTSHLKNDNTTIGFRVQLRKLKRKSCTGCVKCGWLLDDVQERMNDPEFRIFNWVR